MNQMEILPVAKPIPATRQLCYKARQVRMPEFPPGANPGVDSYREIKLYIVNKTEIWLHRNDVEWALRYMFMEDQLCARDTAGSADDMGPDQDMADLEALMALEDF